jgi:hypothetical protein
MFISTFYSHVNNLTAYEDILWKVRDLLEQEGASVLAASVDALGLHLQDAKRSLRTLKPQWDDNQDAWVAIHPDDGKPYLFDLCEESCYSIIQVNAPDDTLGLATLEWDDNGPSIGNGDMLTVTLRDCSLAQTEFLLSDDWSYTWCETN